MPRLLLSLSLALVACTERPGRDDTDPPGETGAALDTAATGETAPTGETAGAEGDRADWALHELTVAGRQDGFDLDGDGEGDNALWVAGVVLDPVIAQALLGSTRVPLLQLSGLAAWVDDEEVRLALFTVEDGDGDASDRATEGETYAAGAAVDEDGLARVSTDGALAGGVYAAALADGSLAVGDVTLESATDLLLDGTADPSVTAGRVGLAVPLDDLLAVAAALGLDTSDLDTLSTLADLDTDDDGDPDAVSAAFAFRGVRCQLDQG